MLDITAAADNDGLFVKVSEAGGTATVKDNNGNEYYKSFEEGDVTFNAFTLYNGGSIVHSSEIVGSKATKYDPTTNLYSVKIVKKYSIRIDEGETYKYTIAVDSGISEVYLEGLSNSGEINPSLLGSNTVKINEWRFSNNYEKQETTLNVSALCRRPSIA